MPAITNAAADPAPHIPSAPDDPSSLAAENERLRCELAQLREKLDAQRQVDAELGEEFEQVRHLERFLESAVENMPDMLFVKDAKELRFVRINRKAEELMGFPRGMLIGKCDYDVFPKDEADFFVAKDRAVLESGQLLDIPEEPMLTAKGPRVLHTKKIPILDAQGRPQYLLGISRDITEKRRRSGASARKKPASGGGRPVGAGGA